MAIKANLVIDQGADYQTSLNITDDDGYPVDLTGYTGVAKIRKHYTSTNAVSFTVTITANTGNVALSLTALQTANIVAGRYVYDVKVTDTDANTVTRLVEGIATITPQVTR